MAAQKRAERAERTEKRMRAREVQRLEREKDARRRQLVQLGTLGAVILAIALIGYALISSSGTPTMGQAQGRQVEIQPYSPHVQVGQSHPAYNSTPPTSGWHWDAPAPWGISNEPIPNERQVHNLEHGGIMVQYNCPQGCPELVEQLKGVASRYRSKVVLAPYPNMDTRIALTAWGWIDQFEEFDEGRIVAFIETRKNHAPEKIPD